MNFVFLMDPLETVKIEKDTSFILMLGAHRRGHKVYFLAQGEMSLKDGRVFFDVLEVIPQLSAQNPFIRKNKVGLFEKSVDAVFVRTDPPFDAEYLLDTWLLDRLSRRIPVINSPSGLRTVNEKLWAAQFTAITPPTLVSRDKKEITDFLNRQKEIILKPTDGFGGSQVFYLKVGDMNTNVIMETVTERFSRYAVVQKYLPAAQKGDKRILLLDGKPLGAVLRVHAKDDHRNNFFAGGHPQKAAINARDKKIISVLKPHLKKLGLYFVGIDIIGDYLIEVNVTSPTCLQEMDRLYNQNLEEKVIGFCEKLVKSRK